MRMEVLQDAEAVARKAAAIIAEQARTAVATRRQFTMAVSGGHTPWIMLRALAKEDVPWQGVHIFQVDERVAPAGDQDRNLTHLRESLLEHAPVRAEQIHAMPVEGANLEDAVTQYAETLRKIAGTPVQLDLVHLGLGPDGHTASLVPGDPVLGVMDKEVALTAVYMGRQRMTITYPVINQARQILWVVTGSEKTSMLPRLRSADPTIPAGRVRQEQATVLADRAAAGELGQGEGKAAS